MISIGCDHAAFKLKQQIIEHLKSKGFQVRDFGTMDETSCDYPQFALAVAKSVASSEAQYGIVLCGTGIGVSITANKVKGIRCALCGDLFSAQMTRLHNDANVLALGARIISDELALQIVDIFLQTKYEGGRHDKRLKLISDYEEGK